MRKEVVHAQLRPGYVMAGIVFAGLVIAGSFIGLAVEITKSVLASRSKPPVLCDAGYHVVVDSDGTVVDCRRTVDGTTLLGSSAMTALDATGIGSTTSPLSVTGSGTLTSVTSTGGDMHISGNLSVDGTVTVNGRKMRPCLTASEGVN